MSRDWIQVGPFVDVVADYTEFKRGKHTTTMPDHRRYRVWLETQVGREGDTWLQQSKRTDTGFVAYRYRFKQDDDALMFKLMFNESLYT